MIEKKKNLIKSNLSVFFMKINSVKLMYTFE